MSIRTWPKKERPREKLLSLGASQLSDAELLAIFFRVGINGVDAVSLARMCLTHAGGLKELLDMNSETFSKIKGMGTAKYTQLQASLELCRRYLEADLKRQSFLNSSEKVKEYFRTYLGQYQREVFATAYLNSQYALISCEIVFEGTIDATQVYAREVVKRALSNNAAAVVFSHNHPSGSLEPSQADIAITRRLVAALDTVDIKTLDHILVGHGAVSFAELGLM